MKKSELVLEISSKIKGVEPIIKNSEVYSSPFKTDIHVKSKGLQEYKVERNEYQLEEVIDIKGHI